MDYLVEDFRHAQRLLDGTAPWKSLEFAISSITREQILTQQRRLASIGRAPKGGQSAINDLFETHLTRAKGWIPQPRLFRDPALDKWTMDFLNERVGVEVSFNHAEAIAWQFTRLNIAGESERVLVESRVDVGVVITADQSLKAWSKMDSAVGTFDAFRAWLREMKPILPIPILLVGLKADPSWPETNLFAGTAKGTRGGVAAVG